MRTLHPSHLPILLLCFLVLVLSTLAEEPANNTKDLSDHIRYSKSHGKLETSILTYRNSAGQQVDLISAVHIGSVDYYQALNEKFQTYDVLLYELILPSKMVGQRLPSKIDSDSSISGLQGMLAKSMGLVSQVQNIDYSAQNFVHADLTSEGLTRKMTERQENLSGYLLKAMASSGQLDQKNLDITDQELAELDMLAVFNGTATARDRKVMRKLFASVLASSGGVLSAMGDTAIIQERNKVAIDVLEEQTKSAKSHFGLFYGAAHMPGLVKRLETKGWKRIDATWVNAWNI